MCAGCIPEDIRNEGHTAAEAAYRRSRQRQHFDPERPADFGARRSATPFPLQPEARPPGTAAATASPAASVPAPAAAASAMPTRPAEPTDSGSASESQGDDDFFECQGSRNAAANEAENLLDILLAMGFKEKDARRALEQNQSLAAAIAWLMSQGAAAAIAFGRAGSGIGAAIQPAAANLGEALQPAADGVYSAANGVLGAVGRWTEQVQTWVRSSSVTAAPVVDSDEPLKTHKAIGGESWVRSGLLQDLPVDSCDPCKMHVLIGGIRHLGGELQDTLVSLGFSQRQASAASQRCSSVEAAIDWIAANPQLVS